MFLPLPRGDSSRLSGQFSVPSLARWRIQHVRGLSPPSTIGDSWAMNSKMARMLANGIVALTLCQVLIMHWLGLALRGTGFGLASGATAAVLLAGLNFLLFPAARRRMRATGLSLLFSRVWILSSVTTLITGAFLGLAFAVVYCGTWALEIETSRESVMQWLGGIVVLLGFGAGLWGSTVGNHRIQVETIPISLPHLPAGRDHLNVVHITDLHIGPLLQPDRLARFVKRINGLDPDLILITGDIFDFAPRYVEDGCRGLAKLTARNGVYAVLGNHDYYTGTEIVVAGLAELTSIRLLRDEWETVEVEGVSIVIAGLEDPEVGWFEKRCESPVLERFASEIPKGLPCILLAHRPSFFDQAQKLGFPLVLAGHTHGGQVALPFANNQNASRMISNETRGLYHRGEATMYVNRGLGMAGLPFRLNCSREIAVLQLTV